MARKHLFLIHGRATKPDAREKARLVEAALLHGLGRVDGEAAARVERGDVKQTFVYYGDINNRLLVAAEPERQRTMVRGSDGVYYEPDGAYDDEIGALFSRPNAGFTREEYRDLVRKHRDLAWVDNLARVVSPVLAGGLSRRIITRYLPDLGAYVTSRKVGSEIRERLQRPLGDALADGDDVALVSHSMGAIASYDVLWKFSHMSEYRHLSGERVSLWLTLGSPLGEPSVRECLYDSNEPADGRYPRNVDRWVNISAYDDFIAHDGSAADDFREMEQLGCRVWDHPRIYTFWVGDEGVNTHKLYGYLDHPDVARQIAQWVLEPTPARDAPRENVAAPRVAGAAPAGR